MAPYASWCGISVCDVTWEGTSGWGEETSNTVLPEKLMRGVLVRGEARVEEVINTLAAVLVRGPGTLGAEEGCTNSEVTEVFAGDTSQEPTKSSGRGVRSRWTISATGWVISVSTSSKRIFPGEGVEMSCIRPPRILISVKASAKVPLSGDLCSSGAWTAGRLKALLSIAFAPGISDQRSSVCLTTSAVHGPRRRRPRGWKLQSRLSVDAQ